MSFTASNVPQWSGNGTELTNGIPLSSLGSGGGSNSGKLELITTFTPTTSSSQIISIPTGYAHLYVGINLVRAAAASQSFLSLSTDAGATYGTQFVVLTANGTNQNSCRAFVYNSGITGTNKQITLILSNGSLVQNFFSKLQTESVKTGIVNTIKISNSTGYGTTGQGTITVCGFK